MLVAIVLFMVVVVVELPVLVVALMVVFEPLLGDAGSIHYGRGVRSTLSRASLKGSFVWPSRFVAGQPSLIFMIYLRTLEKTRSFRGV